MYNIQGGTRKCKDQLLCGFSATCTLQGAGPLLMMGDVCDCVLMAWTLHLKVHGLKAYKRDLH